MGPTCSSLMHHGRLELKGENLRGSSRRPEEVMPLLCRALSRSSHLIATIRSERLRSDGRYRCAVPRFRQIQLFLFCRADTVEDETHALLVCVSHPCGPCGLCNVFCNEFFLAVSHLCVGLVQLDTSRFLKLMINTRSITPRLTNCVYDVVQTYREQWLTIRHLRNRSRYRQ